MEQVHVFYSGRVQGVGFRFTVLDLAGGLGVSGWVSNLADGRVELLAQGQKGKLDELLNRIQEYFSRYIQDTRLEWTQAGKELEGFRVKY